MFVKILRPLKKLEIAVNKIRDGWDITQRIGLSAKDEVGRIGAVFDDVIKKLNEVVLEIQEVSLQLALSSTELLSATEEMSQGAKNQAKHIEIIVNTIIEKTDETTKSIELGRNEVENGKVLIEDSSQNFIDIADSVQETANTVQEQEKASNEIKHFMEEILSISKETVSACKETVSQGNRLRELAITLEKLVKNFKTK